MKKKQLKKILPIIKLLSYAALFTLCSFVARGLGFNMVILFLLVVIVINQWFK